MKTNGFREPFSNGRALSSVVEHFLHTEGVAGSKPAARTILPQQNRNPNVITKYFADIHDQISIT